MTPPADTIVLSTIPDEPRVQERQLPTTTGASMLAVIERAAKDPNIDVEKMERLLAMQERLVAHEARAAFFNALGEFQAQCPQLEKTKLIIVRDRIQSAYCPFEGMMKTVQPLMTALGFAAFFNTSTIQGRVKIVCKLAHRMGHEESSEFEAPIDKSGNKNDVQAVASSISYGKRYSLAAALGIVFKDEDDDAQTATKPMPQTDIQPATSPVAPAFDREGAIRVISGAMRSVVPTIEDSDMDEIMSVSPWTDAPDNFLKKATSEKGWTNILGKFHQMQGGESQTYEEGAE